MTDWFISKPGNSGRRITSGTFFLFLKEFHEKKNKWMKHFNFGFVIINWVTRGKAIHDIPWAPISVNLTRPEECVGQFIVKFLTDCGMCCALRTTTTRRGLCLLCTSIITVIPPFFNGRHHPFQRSSVTQRPQQQKKNNSIIFSFWNKWARQIISSKSFIITSYLLK